MRNIETNPVGMREYLQSVLEKLDIEYEEMISPDFSFLINYTTKS